MTLKQYKERLQKHDWYYSFSEDGRVYDSGLAEEKELKKLAENNSSFKKAYDSIFNKFFNKNVKNGKTKS